VAAWTGTLPFAGGEPVTVIAGASRGRPVYFSIAHDWGASTGAVDRRFEDQATTAMEWLAFLVAAVPLCAALYFSVRNLRLGRGDRAGATRIALFVFAMNLLESAFTARLSEDGPLRLGWDWVSGRGVAHSLLHGATMWFAYVALEPYVRRLWPNLLVSWARLVSGRARDPLVGRDLLIGTAAGAGITALGVMVQFAALRWGHGHVPTLVGPDALTAATSLSLTGFSLAYAGSVSVLETLRVLMVVLVLRLVLRRTSPAVAISLVLFGANAAYTSAPVDGWIVALAGVLVSLPLLFLTLMRAGMLSAVVAAFVSTAMVWSVATLDFSSWYADRALFAMVFIVALLAYGAWTALGGVPILGDPLRDAEPIRRRAPAGV
jgi:serine/threonine-protein kinase